MIARALAEFVMRGPIQASIIAMCYFVPILPQAVIALVTLRKGAKQGSLVTVISILPAAFLLQQSSVALLGSLVLGAIIVYVTALVLRVTVSWSFGLLALLSSVGIGVVIGTGIPELMQFYVDFLLNYRDALEQNGSGLTLVLSEERIQSTVFLSGILALNILLTSLISVLIARWWQAMLFNPGAFGEEFRALSLGKSFAMLYMAFSVLMLWVEGGFFWGVCTVLPICLVAIAIVHSVLLDNANKITLLIIFYVLIVLLMIPMLLMMTVVGFVDHWFNFRHHFAKAK